MAALAGIEPEAAVVLRDRDIKEGAGPPPELAASLASLKLKAAA